MNGITYKDILSNPKEIIPSLVEEDIRVIIIETILAYIERTINLKTVAEMAGLIKQNYSRQLPKGLKDDLDEIHSMYVDEEVLTDILDELTKK